MKRRAQPELQPVYVRPAFDARERAALRAWCQAAYTGDRNRPRSGEFDPLWLRLGLRAHLIDARAGWVVSNPIYDESLRSNPANDPSLPGTGWLWRVYRWHKARELAILPRARSVIEQRLAVLRAVEERQANPPPAAPLIPAQQSLFGTEDAAC